jgi:hypothetical protein
MYIHIYVHIGSRSKKVAAVSSSVKTDSGTEGNVMEYRDSASEYDTVIEV